MAGALERVDLPGPALGAMLPELRRTLEADQAAAWSLAPDEPLHLEHCHTDGIRPGFAAAFSAWLPGAPRRFGRFDPLAPERWQRNLPLRHEDFADPFAHRAMPIRALLDRWDVAPETLRLLLCDGPVLLGWVGVSREAPFALEQRRRLGKLAPAIRRRLQLERDLGGAALCAAALPAALDAVPAAAFLVGPRGVVRQANRVGEVLLRTQGKAVRDGLKRALESKGEGGTRGTALSLRFAVQPVDVPGLPSHHLAIHRPTGDALDHRVSLAAARWGLSDKLARVLALLVRGASNRAIAARLSYADGTVELYVSRILAAAEVESRAELVAKFFMEGA